MCWTVSNQLIYDFLFEIFMPIVVGNRKRRQKYCLK